MGKYAKRNLTPLNVASLGLRENHARETTSLVRLARGKKAAACAVHLLRQLPPGAKSGAQGIKPTILPLYSPWGETLYPIVLVAPARAGGIM